MPETISQFKIPTFHVALDDADLLAKSVERIKQGDKKYSYHDICVLSDWIGLCSFQYMADNFQQKRQRDLTIEDLNKRQMYISNGLKESYIVNDFLQKTHIKYNWCNTAKLFKGSEAHFFILADICTNENNGMALYQPSFKQFFCTNGEGILSTDNFISKTSTVKDFAQNILATKEGVELVNEMTTNGSSLVLNKHLKTYIAAYIPVEKTRRAEFEAKEFSNQDLINMISQKKEQPLSNSRRILRDYCVIPGDARFEETAQRIFTFQKKLHQPKL